MAYRITATTDIDADLLAEIRDLAWRRRQTLSEVIRQAFHGHLDHENISERIAPRQRPIGIIPPT